MAGGKRAQSGGVSERGREDWREAFGGERGALSAGELGRAVFIYIFYLVSHTQSAFSSVGGGVGRGEDSVWCSVLLRSNESRFLLDALQRLLLRLFRAVNLPLCIVRRL